MTDQAAFKNWWTTRNDPPVVRWEARLPVSSDLHPLLAFAQAVLEAGAREGVFQVLETRDGFHAASDGSYADYLAHQLQARGCSPCLTSARGASCAPTAASCGSPATSPSTMGRAVSWSVRWRIWASCCGSYDRTPATISA